jgi:hypothetical protein
MFLRAKEVLVSSQSKRCRLAMALTGLLTIVLIGNSWLAFGQQTAMTRKVKTKVAPVYPETAQPMSLYGTVKLIVGRC